MIKQLKIRNYQSHKDAELNFRPGVNLIVGDSDCGKSALLRALRWLVFNRPSGFTFQSHWAKKGEDTAVEVALSDGNVARRVRNNKDNQYWLSTLEEPLEAVRTDVPEEVKAVLRMDALNVQRQGDKPFLLDESPAEVARVLNTVAGLENIDAAHTRVAGKIRENQADQRRTDSELLATQTKLEAFAELPALQAKAGVLAQAQGRLKAQQEKEGLLCILIHDATVRGKVLAASRDLPTLEKKLVMLQDASVANGLRAIEAQRLAGHIEQVTRLRFRLAALAADNLRTLMNGLETVEALQAKAAPAAERLAQLQELGKTAKQYTDAVAGHTLLIQQLDARMETYNVCPECGAERRHWAKV